MVLTLEQLKKLPKIASFRFDLTIKNIEGESEDVISALTTKVEERDNGITLGIMIPEPVSTAYVSSLIAFLKDIATITVDHNRSDNTLAFSTLHRIISFDNWKLVGSVEEAKPTVIEASYSSEVSFPVTQSEDGIGDWLEALKGREE